MADVNYIEQLKMFLEDKGLTEAETKEHLEDVFRKAFEKDRDALSKYDEEEPESANVEVNIDLETGKIDIKKHILVVDEMKIISRFREVEPDHESIEGLGLKVGDSHTIDINIDEINMGKRQHIKQLFLQKLSEIEKIKVYNKFSKYKGELLTPKVHKVLSRDNVILDYDGDSIFMPANEVSPLDGPKIKLGNPVTIYVLDIEELSKDAQIIASRKHPQFVAKLVEREIDDVQDGIVTVEGCAREAGFKTKIAVSTNDGNVDPVGSIIGVKGQKIKPIIDEIGGERLDVIKYHEDIKQFIAEALLPAEIKGIKMDEEIGEDGVARKTATVIVDQDQFLPALGKRGINIKLAAILTKTKLDVKTPAEAAEEGIEWEPVTKTKFVSQGGGNMVDLEEYENLTEEMAITIDNETDISEYDDYVVDDNFGINDEQTSEDEFFNPDEYDEEDF